MIRLSNKIFNFEDNSITLVVKFLHFHTEHGFLAHNRSPIAARVRWRVARMTPHFSNPAFASFPLLFYPHPSILW